MPIGTDQTLRELDGSVERSRFVFFRVRSFWVQRRPAGLLALLVHARQLSTQFNTA